MVTTPIGPRGDEGSCGEMHHHSPHTTTGVVEADLKVSIDGYDFPAWVWEACLKNSCLRYQPISVNEDLGNSSIPSPRQPRLASFPAGGDIIGYPLFKKSGTSSAGACNTCVTPCRRPANVEDVSISPLLSYTTDRCFSLSLGAACENDESSGESAALSKQHEEDIAFQERYERSRKLQNRQKQIATKPSNRKLEDCELTDLRSRMTKKLEQRENNSAVQHMDEGLQLQPARGPTPQLEDVAEVSQYLADSTTETAQEESRPSLKRRAKKSHRPKPAQLLLTPCCFVISPCMLPPPSPILRKARIMNESKRIVTVKNRWRGREDKDDRERSLSRVPSSVVA